MKKESLPTSKSITTDSFEASKKIFVQGKQHNIQVAMREIAIGDKNGDDKLVVYDTSGPYTDPVAKIKVTIEMVFILFPDKSLNLNMKIF